MGCSSGLAEVFISSFLGIFLYKHRRGEEGMYLLLVIYTLFVIHFRVWIVRTLIE